MTYYTLTELQKLTVMFLHGTPEQQAAAAKALGPHNCAAICAVRTPR